MEFNESAIAIVYEYPLNEHIRSLLRLEFLLAQYAAAEQVDDVWDTRNALRSLFEIQEFCARKELRTELSRTLRQQAATLGRHRNHAGVDDQALEATLHVLDQRLDQLTETNKIERSDPFTQHEFLASVRQRISIPAGSCPFDLPALHHWLAQPIEQRRESLAKWLEPMAPTVRSVTLALKIMRASAQPVTEHASNGFYQQAQEDPNQKTQLLRVLLTEPMPPVYPEFSGNWHRYSIRFLQQDDWSRRAKQADSTVTFELARCTI